MLRGHDAARRPRGVAGRDDQRDLPVWTPFQRTRAAPRRPAPARGRSGAAAGDPDRPADLRLEWARAKLAQTEARRRRADRRVPAGRGAIEAVAERAHQREWPP